MIPSLQSPNRLAWTLHSIRFFGRNFSLIFGLGFVAALGRATQLGAFGPVSTGLTIFLEVLVESARLLIFLYALGLANVKKGMISIATFVTNPRNRRQNWRLARQTLRTQWAAVILNLTLFSVIAVLINLFIDHIAYQTCLYANLQADKLIAEQASEWTLILFFKNLSVIPFTLIFNAVFLLWLVDRLPKFPLRTA